MVSLHLRLAGGQDRKDRLCILSRLVLRTSKTAMMASSLLERKWLALLF